MLGELAWLTAGLGEGIGSLSSLPYSSPLEAAGAHCDRTAQTTDRICIMGREGLHV
jgi:hypothetical protein